MKTPLSTRVRNYLIATFCFFFCLCFCLPGSIIVFYPLPTSTPIPPQVIIITSTPAPTETASPTDTESPATDTLQPSDTPTETASPSDTPTTEPTATRTPTRRRATIIPTNTKRPAPATNTPRNRRTATPTPTEINSTLSPDEELSLYKEQIRLALAIFVGKRDIVSIELADGRANGGERVVIVGYKTIEDDLTERVKELMDIFVVIGATIHANDMDIDSVTLITDDQNDKALAASTASVKDLISYDEGDITLDALVKLVKTESLTE